MREHGRRTRFTLTQQAPSSDALGREEIELAPSEAAGAGRTHTLRCRPYDSLLIKNVRRNFAVLIEGNCGLRDFKGTFYLKYLRKYVPKSASFTYLAKVLKGMQKKKKIIFWFLEFLEFSFPNLTKYFYSNKIISLVITKAIILINYLLTNLLR